MNIPIITAIESAYLLFMYFIFQTNYSFKGAYLEKETQSLGDIFVHDSGRYENKICTFGKIFAIVAVLLGLVRMNLLLCCPDYKKNIITITILFDLFCLLLAYGMNLNAFVYLLPIIPLEAYLLH
jgi:hypothetical protein